MQPFFFVDKQVSVSHDNEKLCLTLVSVKATVATAANLSTGHQPRHQEVSFWSPYSLARPGTTRRYCQHTHTVHTHAVYTLIATHTHTEHAFIHSHTHTVHALIHTNTRMVHTHIHTNTVHTLRRKSFDMLFF